ncbi:hypothetical protein H2200_013266 [Cladophialophora chaetospira]|uniref:AB hydrolase-1 domain-containing protein n=1 Tax=Cladophialophora chaetospira TaxID=386627 RepID=A0AA38U7Y9_9EURO|nr:hypothetical protein H2200_013266 [Cladophialophora chaetospira]
MKMPSSKPTVILVHGSWHSPKHFVPLEDALHAHGYKTNSVWLPSMHYSHVNPPLDPTKVDLHDDIQATRGAIIEALSNSPNTDVAVLSHSYGTVPAAAATENLDKATRAQNGHTNGVSAFLIISGLLIPPGMTSLEWAGGQVPPTVALSTISNPKEPTEEIQVSIPIPDPGPIALFYHDVADQHEARRYAELCTHQIWAVHNTVIPFVGWKSPELEVFYLSCEEDRALPPGFQMVMIDTANRERAAAGGKAKGLSGSSAGQGGNSLEKFQKDSLAAIEESKATLNGVRDGETEKTASGGTASAVNKKGYAKVEGSAIKVTTIKSSHSPFLSRVEETATWVRKSCGEKI